MKKLYLLPLLAAMAGQGCQTPATRHNAAQDSIAVTDTTIPIAAAVAEDSIRMTTETAVQQVIAHTDSIRRVLPAIDPRQAVLLYKSLQEKMVSYTEVLMANEGEWLERYIQTWSETANDYQPPAAMAQRIRLLATAGFEPWYIGEGYSDIRVRPDFYQKLFGNHLPADYKRYIDIEARQDSTLFDADAGVVVPWKEVARRVEEWDSFCSTYPASALKEDAERLYSSYMYIFLVGEDNTRTIEDGAFVPEIKAEMEAYAAANSQTRSGKLTAAFLEMAAKETNRDARDKWAAEQLGMD